MTEIGAAGNSTPGGVSRDRRRPYGPGWSLARASLMILYLTAAAIVFFAAVEPALKGRLKLTLWGDSQTYYDYARMGPEVRLLTLTGNYIGPVILIRVFGKDPLPMFLFNCLVFLLACHFVLRHLPVDGSVFLLLLMVNPMTFASLLSINKEILGLAGLLLFWCYLSTRRLAFLIVAIVVSMIARWHQVLVIAIALAFLGRPRSVGRRPLILLAGLVLLISIVYPLLPLSVALLGATPLIGIQESKMGGLLAALNDWQSHFGFWAAVFPKALLNWFGNLARVGDVLQPEADFETNNLYNYAVVGQQVCMVIVAVLLACQRRLRLRSPILYFFALYSILFSISPFVQYRYFYPVYGLLCLEAARRRGGDWSPIPSVFRSRPVAVVPVAGIS